MCFFSWLKILFFPNSATQAPLFSTSFLHDISLSVSFVLFSSDDFRLLSLLSSRFFSAPLPSLWCPAGQCTVDELHQHAGHLWLCGLLWSGPWPHPLVLCGRALLAGPTTRSYGSGRLFQLDSQLHHWHVLPIHSCKSNSTKEDTVTHDLVILPLKAANIRGVGVLV